MTSPGGGGSSWGPSRPPSPGSLIRGGCPNNTSIRVTKESLVRFIWPYWPGKIKIECEEN